MASYVTFIQLYRASSTLSGEVCTPGHQLSSGFQIQQPPSYPQRALVFGGFWASRQYICASCDILRFSRIPVSPVCVV